MVSLQRREEPKASPAVAACEEDSGQLSRLERKRRANKAGKPAPTALPSQPKSSRAVHPKPTRDGLKKGETLAEDATPKALKVASAASAHKADGETVVVHNSQVSADEGAVTSRDSPAVDAHGLPHATGESGLEHRSVSESECLCSASFESQLVAVCH